MRICEKGPNVLGNIGEIGEDMITAKELLIILHRYWWDIQVAVIYIYPIFTLR